MEINRKSKIKRKSTLISYKTRSDGWNYDPRSEEKGY